MRNPLRSTIIILLSLGFVHLGVSEINAQDHELHGIIDSLRNQVVRRDSLLRNYSMLVNFTYITYENGDSTIDRTERHRLVFRDGKVAERMVLSEDSVKVESVVNDTEESGSRSMEMADPLDLFKSGDYAFILEDSPSPEIYKIRATPEEPTRESYRGTFEVRKDGLEVVHAMLKPGGKIPHVKEAQFDVDFTYFRGVPVTKSMFNRFRGKYLLVFSFDKGMQIEMEYTEHTMDGTGS